MSPVLSARNSVVENTGEQPVIFNSEQFLVLLVPLLESFSLRIVGYYYVVDMGPYTSSFSVMTHLCRGI